MQEAFFWKKKAFVSFILSLLVFLIHISTFSLYDYNGNWISVFSGFVHNYFKFSITRQAVPLFFIISGVTFFRNYNNSLYLSKLKSRVRTLVVPFLIWNTIWMVFSMVTTTFLSGFFVGRPAFVFSVENILCGIFLHEYNVPFWFILVLIILVILAPVMDFFSKNKWMTIAYSAVILGVFALPITLPTLAFRLLEGSIFFVIGAFIGKHCFDAFTNKSSKNTQIISLIVFVLFSAYKYFSHTFAFAFIQSLETIILLLGALSFWNIIDAVADKVKNRDLYKRSFAIYALHINASAIITHLIYIVLPKNEYMAVPNFLLTMVLTVLSINIFCIVTEKLFPKIYGIVMGQR